MMLKMLAVLAAATLASLGQDTTIDHETVVPNTDGSSVTPVNQIVEPLGGQVYLPRLRPQAIALSPDGQIIVTSGKSHDLIVVDPVKAEVAQTVRLPSESSVLTNQEASDHILASDDEEQLSFTGLIFSADGSRVYLSNVAGSIKV